jgi:hypothetical protein
VLAVLSVLAAVLAARPAYGDEDADKRACAEAYEQTQTLRIAGKLYAAQDRAAACAQPSCADFIRLECGVWLGQLVANQPTVVLVAHDATGRTPSAVRVDLDGAPWLDAIDDQPKPIDPGQHVVRFSVASGTSVEQQVDVHEGDKKTLEVSLPTPPPPPPPSVRGSVRRSEAVRMRRPSVPWSKNPATIGAFTLGGLGVASLAAGAVLGGVALHDNAVANAQCTGLGRCSSAGFEASKQSAALAPVSTATLVLGGAAAVTATVSLVLSSRSASRPGVRMGAVVSSTGPSWTLAGAW